MATILYRLSLQAQLQPRYTGEKLVFSDENTITPYAKEAVAAMTQAYVIYGAANTNDGLYFYPKQNATRAEAVAMVNGSVKIYA